MKKTLIALAALAASGASFAQVTLSGNLTMGYKATQNAKAAQNEAAGFGVDTSQIDFSVKEDIGGGQSVQAKMALAGLDRSGESSNGAAAQGRDATLTYTNTSFGQVELGTTSSANYFAGIASAGAPVIDFDGKLFETRSSSDYISYTVPVGPVYIQLNYGEPSGGLGLGKGTTGAAAFGQRNNTISAYYSAGGLTLLGAFRTYDNRKVGNLLGATGFAEYAAGTKDDVTNIQGSYDFGVAKIGAGFQAANASNGVHVNDALVGISVPVGSWTFGGTYARSSASDAKNTAAFGWNLANYNGTATGYSLGASYAISKRTSITTKYARWTHSGYSQYEADGALVAGGGAPTSGLGYDRTATETTILLSHSF